MVKDKSMHITPDIVSRSRLEIGQRAIASEENKQGRNESYENAHTSCAKIESQDDTELRNSHHDSKEGSYNLVGLVQKQTTKLPPIKSAGSIEMEKAIFKDKKEKKNGVQPPIEEESQQSSKIMQRSETEALNKSEAETRQRIRLKLQQQMQIEENYEKSIEQAFIGCKPTRGRAIGEMDRRDHIGHSSERISKKSSVNIEKVKRIPPKSAVENQMTYLRNYAVSFEIPSSMIKTSRFYKKDPRYCLQLLNYIIPGKGSAADSNEDNFDESDHEALADLHSTQDVIIDKTIVMTHNQDGTLEEKPYGEQFEDLRKGVFLKLLFRESQDSGIEEKSQVVLGLESKIVVRQAIMKFSSDSRFLAIYMRELNTIKIFTIDDTVQEPIVDTFDKIKNDQCYWQYPPPAKVNEKSPEIGFIKRLQFSKDSRYLVLLGERQISIIDLQRKEHKLTWSLDNIYKTYGRQYEKIMDFQIPSQQEGKPLKCMVACKSQNQKKVDIFDFDHNFNEEKGEGRYLRQNRFTMTYFSDVTDYMYVKISSNCKKVILINKEENFLMDIPETQAEAQGAQSSSRNGGKILKKRGTVIRKLPQLKNKTVRYISEDNDCFYFIACYDYDQSLDVVYSEKNIFPVEFSRNIEPGILKVNDMNIQTDKHDPSIKRIRLLSTRDMGFFLDQATYTEIEKGVVDEKKGISYSSDSFAPIQAFSAKWPYVAFSGLKQNYLIILNAFDKNIIHRVELPGNPDVISQTFITETNSLYIASQQASTYRLQYIDLDASNRNESKNNIDYFRVQNLIEYQFEDVDSQPLLSLHIRGSSDKEAIDNNEQLIVFLLHQDRLYSWIQTEEHKKLMKEQRAKLKFLQKLAQKTGQQQQEIFKIKNNFRPEKPTFVQSTSSDNFYPINDDSFFLMLEEKNKSGEVVEQKIMQYSVDFNSYDKVEVLNEYTHNELIINFNVDQGKNKILIFSKVAKLDPGQNFKFTIYDFAKKKVNYESIISNKEVCGRLESGLYNIVDGHIYYSNKCIKIRYDLIEQPNSSKFKENEIFDFYQGIFRLNPGERILSYCPLDSLHFHKFVYIITNPIKLSATRIMITPYLHEKRIYLIRDKPNTEYFYTSLKNDINPSRRSIVCTNLTESKYYIFSTRGLLRNRIDYSSKVMAHGPPVCVSENGRNFLHLQKSSITNMQPIVTIFHVTEFEYVLIKQINILEDIRNYMQRLQDSQTTDNQKRTVRKKHGQMINTMCGKDGVNNWIYNADLTEFEFTINDKMDILVKISNKSKHQLKASAFNSKNESLLNNLQDLQVIRKQNKKEELTSSEHFQKLESDKKQLISFKAIGSHLMGKNKIDIEGQKNNREKQLERQLTYSTIFYYQSGQVKTPRNKRPQNMVSSVHNQIYQSNTHIYPRIEQHFLYFVGSNKPNLVLGSNSANELIQDERLSNINGFKMNDKYAFFWNTRKVWAIEFDSFFKEKKLDFEVAESERNKYIADVRSGSNPSLISLIIHQSQKHNCVITWNMSKGNEKEAFDVDNNFELLWDYRGDPFIVQEQDITFSRERVKIQAFENIDFQRNSRPNKTFRQIGLQYGHRFDGINHNWLILNQFLCLGFSYMTFLIKQKIEEEDADQVGNVFDPTPYNYILNKSNAFMDSSFVRDDHEMLEEVLQELYSLDKSYLNQLQYTRKNIFSVTKPMDDDEEDLKRESPLHIAVVERNNRSVDIILKYLSNVGGNNTHFFQDIFPDLVGQKSFPEFLLSQQVQNRSMEDKQILKVYRAYKPGQIAAINHSKCLYLDDKYYRGVMGEDKLNHTFKSYPVSMIALRIGWILSNQAGIDFLHQVWDSENLDIFQNQSVVILVEFLFSKFNTYVTKVFVPLNILQIIVFFVTIMVGESRYSIGEEADQVVVDLDQSNSKLLVIRIFGSFNLILTLIQADLFFIEYRGLRSWHEFITMWRVFEAMFIVLNTILSIEQFLDADQQMQRRVSYFVVIILFTKFLYYLKLIPSLSSHIDVFFDIIEKILSFLVLFIFTIVAFTTVFYMIARNQIQYDKLSVEDNDSLSYSTFYGSLWDIWNLCLGNPETEGYFVGEGGEKPYAVAFFVLASFILLVHLLNMLIAIMSDEFEKNNEMRSKIKIQEQLRFILDKWVYRSKVLGDVSEVKYVVVATILEEDQKEESSLLKHVVSKLDQMERQQNRFQDYLLNQIKDLRQGREEQQKENYNLRNLITQIKA